MEITARELPLERTSDRLIVVLEAEDASRQGLASGEVDRGEGFALEDREVDLDLVQPARVSGQVHENEVGEALVQPAGGTLAAMDGAAVHDPEDRRAER